MKVYITPEFIKDIRESADLRFIRQVFNHTLNTDGTFKQDADDHRYNSIKDAWIRYISKGNSAYRVLYLRQGDVIYLYRAGQHSIEERVGVPNNLQLSIPVCQKDIQEISQTQFIDNGIFVKTDEPVFINKIFKSMYHVGHKEIIIMSPFIDLSILDRHHHFGSFLDKAIEEDTLVAIITRPPNENEQKVYKDLEERNIFVYFCAGLHSKLYIFDVNPTKVSQYNRDIKRTVIIGSSNLTKRGIGFDDEATNYELCYRLSVDKYGEAYNYAKKIIMKSADYKDYFFRLKRR